MRKRFICDLHDEVIELCLKQQELVSTGKTHLKAVNKNFEKMIRLLAQAKEAGQAMENRMTTTRDLLEVYVEDMGFDIKRKKRKAS